jgi:hypothetical protein
VEAGVQQCTAGGGTLQWREGGILAGGPNQLFKFKQNHIWIQFDSLQTLAFKPLKFWRIFLVKDYEPRNNFGYWNPLRFEINFELKFREAKVMLKSFEI